MFAKSQFGRSRRSVAVIALVLIALLAFASACAQQPAAEPEPTNTSAPEPTEAPADTAEEEPTEEPTEMAEEEPTEAPSDGEETDGEATGGELAIGLPLPFSGQYAWVGSNVMPVAEMIAEEVNSSGGIGGSTITLVQGDTEGTVDAGTTAAQKLVNVDNVLAFMGPTSLSFSGVRTIIQDNGVPMVSPTAGTTELNEAGTDYFFRTVPSDSLGGRAIARAITSPDEYMGGAGPYENVVLMVGQAPALISFRDPIAGAMDEYGTPVATTIEYTTEKQAYRTEVQEALDTEPGMIILVGTPQDSARIMQNAFEAGYEGDWFVTQDQTNADFIDLASPELAEGIYGLEEVPPEDAADRLEAFQQRFQEYSGDEVQIFGTNTYDAANVLYLAMLRAQLNDGEVTRETIAANIDMVANSGEDKVEVTNYTEGKEALEAGDEINYQGLVGPINFDDYGNITAPFGVRQVQDGEWSAVATVNAEDLQ